MTDIVKVWPNQPPAWNEPTEPEGDLTKPDGREVAGKPVIRLGNVAVPELHLFPAEGSDSTVIVCPGGGFSILAWDLEGIEIARWLQSHGVSAAVLKYRVPSRDHEPGWLPPVQDLQRSVSLIRGNAIPSLRSKHVGVLGFSAGGHTATRAAFGLVRHYVPVDKFDETSCEVDFAALIYTAYLTTARDSETLRNDLTVSELTPPIFFAHAFDDPYTCMGAVQLFAEMKRKNVPSSLHVFSAGGHGFGGRESGEENDLWLPLFKSFLVDNKFA
ncbi:MAG: alpha/beta hydrolase [Planctomycetota bacterium]